MHNRSLLDSLRCQAQGQHSRSQETTSEGLGVFTAEES